MKPRARRSKRRRIFVILVNPGTRLLALASAAMRPEVLSSEQMRGIVREFQALKATVH